MIRTAPTALALLIAAASGHAVFAQSSPAGQPDMHTYTQQVRFPDADLGGPAGAKALLRRIEMAADSVCGGQPTSAAEYGANQDYNTCRRATVAAAVAQLNSPLLTAEASGRKLTLMAKK